MKILITGGAGFIGSHVTDECIEAGHQVTVLDIVSGKYMNPAASYRLASILDAEGLNSVVQEVLPDAIIHLAGQISVSKSVLAPVPDAWLNIMGSLNVFEAARKYDCRIVFSSTAAVYGNIKRIPVMENTQQHPRSPYGLSKKTVEQYLEQYQQLYGIKYVILRFFNVYGPRQDARGEGGVIAVFADRFVRRQPITINGDGLQTRDFVFVRDVSRACLAACHQGSGIVNIGTGFKTTIKGLFETLVDLTGYKVPVTYGPPKGGDIRHSLPSPKRAEKVLGWKAQIPLVDGLRQTIDFFREQAK